MKISGVKKIEQKVFKNSKGDLLKFVSKKNSFFKSFGEIYFNEIKQNQKKGWIQHKKNYCLFSVAYGEVNFKLIDGRKNSQSLEVEENITLSKNKHNILLVPPGVWFCFTTKKKKSVIVNLINNPHSDKESIKSDNINGYRIKN
jgi:dTDP-4-dehydrorhamnose 3,5-epimerase-like enzyme